MGIIIIKCDEPRSKCDEPRILSNWKMFNSRKMRTFKKFSKLSTVVFFLVVLK